MKKTIAQIFVLCTCFSVIVSCLSGCSQEPKREVYEIDTELGDHLSVEVYLSGNMHGMYLKYDIFGTNYRGFASFWDRSKPRTEVPSNPLKTFIEIGIYGVTHFYKMCDQIIYAYNNECIDNLPLDYDLDHYNSDMVSQGNEFMEVRRKVISDLMKTGNFDYIYQYGPILAYEEDEEMKQLLQRYANGTFSDEELSTNHDSLKTKEEMILWSQELLNEYYS